VVTLELQKKKVGRPKLDLMEWERDIYFKCHHSNIQKKLLPFFKDKSLDKHLEFLEMCKIYNDGKRIPGLSRYELNALLFYVRKIYDHRRYIKAKWKSIQKPYLVTQTKMCNDNTAGWGDPSYKPKKIYVDPDIQYTKNLQEMMKKKKK
jgi:hypothetical protein